MYHVPVLLKESVDGLQIDPDGIYVDVTFGGGGHSREILRRLGPGGKLYAFDQDADALKNKPEDERLTLIHGNFRFIGNYLRYYHVEKVNGILADLGVSSHHFDEVQRGFTFQSDAPLDMRMNTSANLTAAKVLNEYPESSLSMIFSQYGEIDNARKLANFIVTYRQNEVLKTNQDLIAAAGTCIPRFSENKYLAKVFQALRIEVNGELNNLRAFLEQSVRILVPGGRLSVITYHSLEDRLVKQFLRQGKFDGEAEKDLYGRVFLPLRALQSKVIQPSEAEIAANSRARSAKLRIAERTELAS
ncbi:MAG: 16S rRNA (cytosine(1402)-N(4))-methyltransferase RsmH [Bacteroidales bacterium]|nr:16S rRNA (cytosine(1402)-N(4))-methyltransferase RsmH [Bacteroidales bacterium]